MKSDCGSRFVFVGCVHCGQPANRAQRHKWKRGTWQPRSWRRHNVHYVPVCDIHRHIAGNYRRYDVPGGDEYRLEAQSFLGKVVPLWRYEWATRERRRRMIDNTCKAPENLIVR